MYSLDDAVEYSADKRVVHVNDGYLGGEDIIFGVTGEDFDVRAAGFLAEALEVLLGEGI